MTKGGGYCVVLPGAYDPDVGCPEAFDRGDDVLGHGVLGCHNALWLNNLPGVGAFFRNNPKLRGNHNLALDADCYIVPMGAQWVLPAFLKGNPYEPSTSAPK